MRSINQKRKLKVAFAVLCAVSFLLHSCMEQLDHSNELDTQKIPSIVNSTLKVIQDKVYYLGVYDSNASDSYDDLALLEYDLETGNERLIGSICSTPVCYTVDRIWYRTPDGLGSCLLSDGSEQLEIASDSETYIAPVAADGTELILERYYAEGDAPAQYIYSVWDYTTKEERTFFESRWPWDIYDWNGERLIYALSNGVLHSDVYCFENGSRSILVKDQYSSFEMTGDVACWVTTDASGRLDLFWKTIDQEEAFSIDISFMGSISQLDSVNDTLYLLKGRPCSLYSFVPSTGKVELVERSLEFPLVFGNGCCYYPAMENEKRVFVKNSLEPLYSIN